MPFSFGDLAPSLRDLIRGYATLSPVRSLIFPNDVSFWDIHNCLLTSILLNVHFIKYAPSAEYQSAFWKWAIENLQNTMDPTSEDEEIDGAIYEHYTSLQSLSTETRAVGMKPPSPCYLTYFWHSGNGLYESATVLESRTTIESGTTGLRTWPASLFLAQHLIQYPDLVRDKCILELGSGSGLLGIIVAVLQYVNESFKGSIELTDVNEDVLERCRHNISLQCNLSSVNPSVGCQRLDWTDALDESRHPILHTYLQSSHFDLVVGADVVYDPSIIPALVHTIRLSLECGPTCALIALTVRNEDTYSKLFYLARQHLHVEELPVVMADVYNFWGTKEASDKMEQQHIKILQMSHKRE